MVRSRIFARIIFFLFVGFVAFDKSENIWVKTFVFIAVLALILLEFWPMNRNAKDE